MSGSVGSQWWFSWLPTLRFRAKILLGFACVLAISAASLVTAYLGFERVSQAVASYHNSVSEADLARNIDRELLAYRSAVKYFVVTGKEDDAKAAQDAQANLKNAIDEAVKSAKQPARQDGLNKLAKEFSNFSTTFAKVLQAKRDSTLLVQNQLMRNANLLKYKLDDIGNNASDSEAQAIEFGSRFGQIHRHDRVAREGRAGREAEQIVHPWRPVQRAGVELALPGCGQRLRTRGDAREARKMVRRSHGPGHR